MIEAVEKLGHPNIYFLMCGIGEKKEQLESYVSSHGLGEHIRFVGFRSDLHEILQSSDCFVLSSFREGLSVALMEAMAEGLPLIATKSGGVREYVNEDTALLIERENVTEEIQNAILFLKAHPEVRKQMSEKAKLQSKKYDETLYYENFVKTIEEIEEG